MPIKSFVITNNYYHKVKIPFECKLKTKNNSVNVCIEMLEGYFCLEFNCLVHQKKCSVVHQTHRSAVRWSCQLNVCD